VPLSCVSDWQWRSLRLQRPPLAVYVLVAIANVEVTSDTGFSSITGLIHLLLLAVAIFSHGLSGVSFKFSFQIALLTCVIM